MCPLSFKARAKFTIQQISGRREESPSVFLVQETTRKLGMVPLVSTHLGDGGSEIKISPAT